MATQQDIGTDALLMRMRFFEDEHDDLVHSWSGQKYTPKAVGFEEIERAVRMPRLLAHHRLRGRGHRVVRTSDGRLLRPGRVQAVAGALEVVRRHDRVVLAATSILTEGLLTPAGPRYRDTSTR